MVIFKTTPKPNKKNTKASRVKINTPGSDQDDVDMQSACEEREMDGW